MIRYRQLVALACLTLVGCGAGSSEGQRERGPGRGGPPGASGGRSGEPAAAVPVEAVAVERRDVAATIETHGTLEAENEVDLVARTDGPVEAILVEEGAEVAAGFLLARLDQDEIRADLEIARVELDDAERAHARASRLQEGELVSREAYDEASARLDAARARYRGTEILLGYTEIRAPFGGLVVERYVKLAQHVRSGDRLFRLSDFDPLLCPIQVPERELPRLAVGQTATVAVASWGDERFPGRLERIRPVVDAATGTVEVTLRIDEPGPLRPGMFAEVALETEIHEGALVIPRRALVLDAVIDTVYVVAEGVADRREIALGVRQRDVVEVVSGLEEGELVVVVGQDGLSPGTPIQVLEPSGAVGEAGAG